MNRDKLKFKLARLSRRYSYEMQHKTDLSNSPLS